MFGCKSCSKFVKNLLHYLKILFITLYTRYIDVYVFVQKRLIELNKFSNINHFHVGV